MWLWVMLAALMVIIAVLKRHLLVWTGLRVGTMLLSSIEATELCQVSAESQRDGTARQADMRYGAEQNCGLAIAWVAQGLN